MKQFIATVEDIEAEEERERQVLALMEGSEDKPAMTRSDAEAEVDNTPYSEFELSHFVIEKGERVEVKRVLRAYEPTDGQLAFMMASLGRGQSDQNRFAAIVNIMLETLRESDKDYFEGRLLTRDRNMRLPVSKVEAIFEYLTEEWFARPTQP